MKKTELAQFKEEYESAVRNVDEIINNPYTAILLKYKKAEESDYCIKFRQYALRYWGQLHGVDFSEFGDKDITVDEFNHALSMAQIEKKTDFEGGGGNAENNIIDQIKRRLNTMDGFIEMARFSISFEEAKAFKASRNQGIRKNEWHDLTVVVGIRSKIQR